MMDTDFAFIGTACDRGQNARKATVSQTPGWKIRRELSRVLGQFAASPAASLQFFFGTPYHDLILARRRRITSGTLSLGKRVAVYLMFPRNGLLPSHLTALGYLSENGYSPLVVSNAPLSATDRATLLKHCSQLIERANFGYDFGGYRDAVLWLAPRLASMDRLVLLNDSCWFPLPGARNWLVDADALQVDYAAATWTGAVDRPAPWNFEKVRWQIDKTRRNFHYGSYALRLSARVLADPDFLRFWRRFRLAQAKNRTVRRGEIGLTKWIIDKGYTHAATSELNDLDARLSAMTPDELDMLLGQLVIFDDREMEDIRSRIVVTGGTMGGQARWRVEQLILAVTARRGAAYALADFLARDMKFPFLKKSPAAPGTASAQAFRELVSEMEGRLRDEILSEI